MNRNILLIPLLLIFNICLSQSNCKLMDEYENIFKIEKQKFGKKEVLIKSVKMIDSNSCFSDLINNNNQYIDYLLTNFSDNSRNKDFLEITDTALLRKRFYSSLKKDTLFNREVTKLVSKVKAPLSIIPDTFSMNDVMNIAVKFFSIEKINRRGDYVAMICTGVNGLKKTERSRNPQLEAFCFAVVMNDIQKEESKIYDEFVKGIKTLYQINLGIDKEERLLRAQGALYMSMKNNEKLKEMLIQEYQSKKKFLPFIITF